MLKPGRNNKYTVAAQSATFHVLPFLGQVLEEPLSLPPSFTTFTALPVKAGEVIGLTVPTWAPVLTYNNLNATKFTYRQSRKANCTHAAAGQTAQMIGRSEHAVPVRLLGHEGRVRRDRGRQHPVPQEVRPLITGGAARRPAAGGRRPLAGPGVLLAER